MSKCIKVTRIFCLLMALTYPDFNLEANDSFNDYMEEQGLEKESIKKKYHQQAILKELKLLSKTNIPQEIKLLVHRLQEHNSKHLATFLFEAVKELMLQAPSASVKQRLIWGLGVGLGMSGTQFPLPTEKIQEISRYLWSVVLSQEENIDVRDEALKTYGVLIFFADERTLDLERQAMGIRSRNFPQGPLPKDRAFYDRFMGLVYLLDQVDLTKELFIAWEDYHYKTQSLEERKAYRHFADLAAKELARLCLVLERDPSASPHLSTTKILALSQSHGDLLYAKEIATTFHETKRILRITVRPFENWNYIDHIASAPNKKPSEILRILDPWNKLPVQEKLILSEILNRYQGEELEQHLEKAIHHDARLHALRTLWRRHP